MHLLKRTWQHGHEKMDMSMYLQIYYTVQTDAMQSNAPAIY